MPSSGEAPPAPFLTPDSPAEAGRADSCSQRPPVTAASLLPRLKATLRDTATAHGRVEGNFHQTDPRSPQNWWSFPLPTKRLGFKGTAGVINHRKFPPTHLRSGGTHQVLFTSFNTAIRANARVCGCTRCTKLLGN